MDEPIGKMEAHNKVPRGFLVLFFGLIAFGVYYIAAYTPGISGWSQYKALSKEMEAWRARGAALETRDREAAVSTTNSVVPLPGS